MQVQPIAQFGAEIWGLTHAHIIEKIHLSALKRFLGVDRRTPNDLIYGEFGRYPIYLKSYVRCIHYWLKLTRMEENILPFKCYKMLFDLDSRGKSTWVTNVRICLSRYGFQYVWINQGVGCVKSFIACFKQRIIDCRSQDWSDHIRTSERFSEYCMFKTSMTLEPYLSLNLNRYIMNALVKFRLGISRIAQHANRYSNSVDHNSMVCHLCHDGMENDVHFMLYCPLLEDLRHALIPSKFSRYPCKFRLYLLLANKNENLILNVAMFLYKAQKRLDVAYS